MKRLAVGVLVFLGVTTAALATELVSPSFDYDAAVSALKAAGQPVCAADIAVKIPDSQNAALVYMDAAKILSTSAGGDVYRIAQLLDPNFHGKSADLWTTARSMTNRYPKVIALVQKASSMPQCQYPAGIGGPRCVISYPGCDDARLLATFLSTSALVHSRYGKMEDSVRCLGLAFMVSESLKNEPTRYGFGTRERCHATASLALQKILLGGKLDASQAKRLFDQLGTVDFYSGYKNALIGERALFIQANEGMVKPAKTSGEPARTLVASPHLMALQLEELKSMQKSIDSSSAPSTYSRLTASRDTVTARIAGNRVLLALCAYHAKYHAYPKSLADLKTKLRWKLPVDPFSGKDLQYKTAGKGFVLYSVGPNLKDDQGTSPKAGESAQVAGDIVWKQDS